MGNSKYVVAGRQVFEELHEERKKSLLNAGMEKLWLGNSLKT